MPTLLVPPLVVTPLIARGRREARLRTFAAANGLVYDRRAPGAPAQGALFQLGHEQRTLRRFRGSWGGRRFEVGNFVLRTQPGRRCCEVTTGYLILGPLPVPGAAQSWCRQAPPGVLPTTHVERSADTVVAHTLDPLDFADPGTWELVQTLRVQLAG
ncbi:hypothetical protein [Herbiconiux sp. VKM Ac-2851]|uniref:hypothetical protein n=1 Tax=Herbiconiux sp. VKM Ac-2851 TaxID=2739025 RepID=UPI001564CE97|nr:hypothetical protein [Herbiconiux sp. VKM Ac-2851]NQX36166.1 hypothetical protein [Herbiconiux sp. VKM Ac-2851]